MGADLLKEGHNRLGASKHNLSRCDSAGGEKICGLALESVKGVQAEKLVENGGGLWVEGISGFGRGDGFVEVLDDKVLRVGGGEAPEVNEKAVPGSLLDIAMLEGLEGKVGGAPGKSVNDILVVIEDVESGTDVSAGEVVLEDTASVVLSWFSSKDRASRFEELWSVSCSSYLATRVLGTYVSGNLLGQHVVVALPGHGWEVVSIPRANAAVAAVAMTTASTAADLQSFGSNGTSKCFETTRSSMEISEKVGSGIEFLRASTPSLRTLLSGLHKVLVLLIQCHHATAGEMKGECGGKERQQSDLNHLVIDNLVLTLFSGRRIAVLELSPDGTVSCGNCDASCKDTAGLKNNSRTDPGQGAVHQRGQCWTNVFAGLRVNS